MDRLDANIVDLIAQRFSVCGQIAEMKGQAGIPVMQPGRVLEVRQRCARLGAERGLNPDFVDQLYQLIIAEVCRVEEELIETQSAGTVVPAHRDPALANER
jgi:4-amino-4-deoxychorismate mutase